MRRVVTCGSLLLLFMAQLGFTLVVAQPTKRDDKPKPVVKDKEKAKPVVNEKAKEAPPVSLPDDAIIAIFDSLDKALAKSPHTIILSAGQYQAMRDEIEKLKRQLDRPRLRRPFRCALKGKVDGNLVQLTAQFEFSTEKADEVLRLGCGLGQATGVSLDGRTPRLRRQVADKADSKDEPNGFLVEIDKPGVHELTLDLFLSVTSKSATQGIALDLPRAAITKLDLELPDKVRDIRIGGKPLADTFLKREKNVLIGDLGPSPLDRLELTWQPSQAGGAAAVVVAEGLITARLDARELNTEAKLTLRVQSGQVKQWSLLVPPKAELRFSPDDQARIARIDSSEQKQVSLRTIHLKDATSDPLAVAVTHTQPAPQSGTGKTVSVGPFVVLGAARHAGSLLVCNSVPDLHPEFSPHADLTRRSISDDEQRREPTCVAAFRYGPGKMTLDKGDRSALVSWLDVEVESVRGQIKTRSSHVLKLVPDNDSAHARWHVQTRLEITPRWADVDRLTVQFPPACTFVPDGSFPLPERVQSISQDPATRLVTIRLARGASGERLLTPFVVRIEGIFSAIIDVKAPGKDSFSLPTPVGTTERDGTISAVVPAGVELVSREENGLEVERHSPQEILWRYPRRTPATLPLAWQPHRPAVVMTATADLTVTAAEVRVRHELRYSWPAGPAPRLGLRVPGDVANTLRVIEGGRPVGLEAEPGASRTVLLDFSSVPQAEKGLLVVLEYRYALPSARAGTPTLLPLVVPLNVTRGETRVRMWCDPGQLPGPASGWVEQNIEVVAGRSRLPILVLRSDQIDRPLAVMLGQGTGLFALIDRALVRVEVAGNGAQSYRVSYRLARLAGRHLDFELPAPAPTIQLQVTLDDRRIDYEIRRADSAEKEGRVVRLRLSPELLRARKANQGRSSALLAIAYRLDPDRLRGSTLTTPLVAPRLLGDGVRIPTRWRIHIPPSWVVLGPEAGPATPRIWSRRGWLLAPRVEVTPAELERWLLEGDPPTSDPTAPLPSLVLWHEADSPVSLTHLPQQVWLLVCSLGVVLLGLLLARLVKTRDGEASSVRVWLVLGLAGGGLIMAGLLLPNFVGQLAYGCQPGVAVLLVLASVQWLLHERYRRQIIFLPSFSRTARTGSSLLRSEPRPEPRPHGQPSTVDVPRPIGSSVERSA